MDASFEETKKRLEGASQIAVLTGAGISADSGVPTFRGPDGLWKNFRAEELATPEAFRRDPRLVWEWYNWRRELISTKMPNPGHFALATLENRTARYLLITQNVDGLHRRAGSRRMVSVHGEIWKVRCTRCNRVSEDLRVPIPIPPSCEACGAMLRPHIVWFGESLDPADFEMAVAAIRGAEVFLSIGTSSVVQPAASFAQLARSSGAYVVEINPQPACDAAHAVLVGRAADLVPKLI